MTLRRERQDGPTAIVTGGSRGLGLALAHRLVERGWEVVIDGRDATALRSAARSVGATGVPGDITDGGHRAALVASAVRRSGRIDLLVNNAGALGPSPLPPLARYPLPALRSLLDTNVVAQLAMAQAALPLLRESGGSVVNITSDAAHEPYPGWGGYGASKAALEQLGAVLAAEEPAVRVWSFDPGDMRTRMHQEAFPGEDISDRPDPATVVPAILRLLEARPPSGPLRAADLAAGTAAEVACEVASEVAR